MDIQNLRSCLISVLNNRRCKRYRQGVLQFAVLCGVIGQDEWAALFHRVRCGQRTFTEDDFRLTPKKG